MRLRALIYARVSKELQEDNDSLRMQILKAQDFCNFKDYDIYKTISDVESGGKTDRAGYQQLLREISSNTFDVLVIYETSRISRNSRELLNFIFKLESKNIKFVSISQPELDTTSATGKLFFTVQAGLSEYERKQTSIRIKSNKMQRAKEGRWQGGFLPLGYKKNEDGEIVINKEDAKKVIKFFQEYKEGASALNISKKYNINLSSLFYILGNKFYLGIIPYGKRENNVDTNKVKINEKFKYFFKGNHPAIIDNDTFEIVEKRLQKRHRTSKSNSSMLLFSSLIVCECGNKMYKSCTKGYNYYKCEKCKKSISEIRLNKKIIEELFKISEIEMLNKVKDKNRTQNIEKKIKQLNIEKLDYQKQQKELLQLRLKKIISDNDYIENKSEIDLKLDLIDAELTKYKKLKEIEESKFTKSDNVELLRNVILTIDDADKKELNEIFKMLISEIRLIKNKELSLLINLGI